MSLKQTPVLVTGAGGFIGSHLVERLLDAGANVRCFVRYNSRGDYGFLGLFAPSRLEQLDIVQGDLKDEDAVRDAAAGVEVIFHLGAIIPIPYSYVHPREVIETNVTGTFNILAAARAHGGIRVVHTSTSEVYGTAQYTPIDESHPLQGQSPYAASKIAADKLAESFYLSYDLPVVTVRPFNAYGPRQSARAIIPTVIAQALTRNRVMVGDLEPTRDFNFVEDLADAFVRAGASDRAVGEVINVGSGQEISIGDLTRLIIELTGRSVEVVQDERRKRPAKSEVRRLLAANGKAKRLLGWRPQTPLREGLRHTIEWIDRHIERYRPDAYQI